MITYDNYQRVWSRAKLNQRWKNEVSDTISRLHCKHVEVQLEFLLNRRLWEYTTNVTNMSPFPLDLKSLSKSQEGQYYFYRMTQLQAEKSQNETNVNLWIWTCCTNRANIYPNLKYIIFVPESLSKRVLYWYNEVLKIPGASIMYSTMIQYMTWPVMKSDIQR